MFEQLFQQALHIAEDAYDHVIRRWGNTHFARSTVYDWVWSEDFLLMSHALNERERGQLRIMILERFYVKPWPWYSSSYSTYPTSER